MNKTDVMNRIGTDVVLSEIAEHEKSTLENIIDLALAHPLGVARWRAYERLKRQASDIVGWGARQARLRTCRHYEAMIGLIDEVLPVPDENDVDDPTPHREESEEEAGWLRFWTADEAI